MNVPESESDGDEEGYDEEAMEVEASNHGRNAPQVDEDGFTLVTRRK